MSKQNILKWIVQYIKYCYLALTEGQKQGQTHPMVQKHLLLTTCVISSADDRQYISQ